MNNNFPLIACVITTYNRALLLERAIKSVLNQTYRNIELIVVDDYSTDNTEQVVNSLEDCRVQYVKNTSNKGLSYSRNLGVMKSLGKFVAFLDDDDEWLPEKLEKQLNIFFSSNNQDLGLVYTWMAYKTPSDVVQVLRPLLSGMIFDKTIDDQPIAAGSTWMVDRRVFENGIMFDVTIPRGVDGDFIRQLALVYEVDYVQECLVDYHIEHDHIRMTNDSNEGISKAIVGQEITLKKFEDQIVKYPKQFSNLLSITAYDYVMIGDYINAVKYFYRALRVCFYSVSIYKNVTKSILYVVGYRYGR
jgi:glycosyltransferase involved in cell wall biosynthesis